MSYIPATVNLTGDDAILEGATYYRTFTIKDSGGSAIDISSYDIVRCEFRTDEVADGGVTTGCPQPTMLFVNKPSGIVGMVFDPDTWAYDASGSPSPPISVYSGVYHIELEDTVYTGYASPASSIRRVERVVEGSWAVDKEVTLDS